MKIDGTLIVVTEKAAHIVSTGEQGPAGPPGSSSPNGGIKQVVSNQDGTVSFIYGNDTTDVALFTGVIDGGEFI